MKPTVYIETTIPSFYHSTRLEPEMVAMRNWTRSWWHEERDNYQVFTSDAVVDELETGDHPLMNEKIELIRALPFLEINEAVADVVAVYHEHRLMPKDDSGDALHLALASFHKCDYLLTWNCKHLANANKFGHIRRINGILCLATPELVTPLELVQESL
ncbi:MAG: type II toxin-antitoxin system VapC family toxin [Verrucomicrobiae bacterium]